MDAANGARERVKKQFLTLQSNTREGMDAARDQGKWTGRPPFGFDVGAEGYLSPNDDYESALVIIDELDKGTRSANSHSAQGSPDRRSGGSTRTMSGI